MTIMDFNSATFTASYGTAAQLPTSTRPEVAFVGRSNVGKSSIMNKIFGRKSLVKVSSTPGKTSTVNFFAADGVDFVDLPGYGYAKVAKSDKGRWNELIDGYFADDRRFALVVALVDIRHDASVLDRQMVEFLASRGVPFMICFTKADKLGSSARAKQMKSLCAQLATAGDVVVALTSSADGTGIEDLRHLIVDAVTQQRG